MAGIDWLDTVGIYEGGTRQQAFIRSLSGSERTAPTVYSLFHTISKEEGTLFQERRCGMMEVLSEAPEIIAIGQEHVPERLRRRTLIFYIEEGDCVVLAGWGEHTAALAELIREYLELLPSDQEGIIERFHDMGLPGIAMEILTALGRIYKVRGSRKI